MPAGLTLNDLKLAYFRSALGIAAGSVSDVEYSFYAGGAPVQTVNILAKGAVGNGVVDDGPAINAAINASSVGDIIFFPGGKVYATTVPIALRGGRRYLFGGQSVDPNSANGPALIQQKAGTNAAITTALVGTYNHINNITSGDAPMDIEGLVVDVNKANCVSSTASGLVMMGYWARMRDISVYNSPAAGILFTDKTTNATVLGSGATGSECRLDSFRVGNCFVGVQNNANTGNNCCLDGQITRGYIASCNKAMDFNISAGWYVKDIHAYGIDLPASTISGGEAYAFNFNNGFATFIDGIYLEGYGSAAVAAAFYYGMQFVQLAGRSSFLTNINFNCDDSSVTPGRYCGIIIKAASGATTASVVINGYSYLGNNGATGTNVNRALIATNNAGGVLRVDADNVVIRQVLGSISTAAGNTCNYSPSQQQQIAYAATITPDPVLGYSVNVGVLTNAITVNAPGLGTPSVGMKLRLIFTQDATGGRVVTFNAIFKVSPAWVPVTTASKVNIADFEYNGTNWIMVGASVGL